MRANKEPIEISKSQRKREAQELLVLAKKLLALPLAQLGKVPLDEQLREALDFGRSIRAHGARKRQLQTIAKMLRNRDAEPIADAVKGLNLKNRQENIRHHRIEAWRDHLIEGDDQQLSVLLEKSPGTHVQTLRQLIRNAKQEARLGKPPAAARKLFKLLRESDEKNPLPPLSED